MSTDLAKNADGTVTLYVAGKKVMKGTLAQIVAHLTGDSTPVVTAKRPKKVRPKSRTQRWADAASAARDALQDLEDMRAEFEEWRDNLPENLSGSALADKLDTVKDLDIQSAIDMVDEAEGADLPLGFGRD